MRLSLNASEEDLRVFLEEADEQLQMMDEDLISLEKDPNNTELLQEVFRAAHTLKGSSATIGHTKMARLTHAMETVLDHLRKGDLSVGKPVIDALLQGLDCLRVLKSEVETQEESGIDLTSVLKELEDVGQVLAGDASAGGVGDKPIRSLLLLDHERQYLESETVKGRSVYELTVLLEENNPLAQARAFQVLWELASVGKVVKSIPTLAEIEAGEKVGDQIRALLATDADAEQVRTRLAFISDIQAIDLQDWNAQHKVDERRQNQSAAAFKGDDRRLMDLGPAARGKPPDEMLRIAAQKLNQMSRTVRIDVERLDALMNLVGELVIDRTRLLQIGSELEHRYADEQLVRDLAETSQHVGRITDQLQEQIMKSRMLPIETVFNKFPRLVRDLAVKMNKKVDFVIEGQETELDRSVIEEISDPLIHLLRNAVDHGVESPEIRRACGKPESALVRLSARHEDNHILITLEDDGKGIDLSRVKRSAVEKGLISPEVADRLSDEEAMGMIFESGLSTASKVSDISGRGVGLDIVRTNIEKLNGTVSVQTKLGQGTTFVVRLPLTLAIIQALLVSVSSRTYAIPLSSVTETLRFARSEIKSVNKREVVQLRGGVLPLIWLRKELGKNGGSMNDNGRLFVVSVRYMDRQVGLVVDSLVGQQEVVIKPLGSFIGDIKGIAGATILGDGRVALILDVASLVKRVIEEQTRGVQVHVGHEVYIN